MLVANSAFRMFMLHAGSSSVPGLGRSPTAVTCCKKRNGQFPTNTHLIVVESTSPALQGWTLTGRGTYFENKRCLDGWLCRLR